VGGLDQIFSQNSHKVRGGRRGGSGLISREKGVDLLPYMVDGIIEVDIFDDELVGLGASRGGGGDQPTVREVTGPPEVDGSYVPVVLNEHVGPDFGSEVGEGMVVGGKVGEKRGPDR
jgi:hypothetical protein